MNKRIQIIIPEEIAHIIKQIAAQEDRSISNYARKIIMEKIKNDTHKTDLQ